MTSVNQTLYVAHLLRGIFDQLEGHPGTATINTLRPWIPFCLHIAHGKVLPLNRDYKPLGLPNGTWVDYDDPVFDSLRFDASLVNHLPGELDGGQLYITRSFMLNLKRYRANYLIAARRLLGPLLRTCEGRYDAAA